MSTLDFEVSAFQIVLNKTSESTLEKISSQLHVNNQRHYISDDSVTADFRKALEEYEKYFEK